MNFTDGDGREKHSQRVIRAAIELYVEGNGFRRISRLLKKILDVNVCYQLVIHWIKSAAKKIDLVRSESGEQKNKVPIMEFDELFTYIKKKQIKSAVWTAVDRNRVRFAGFEVGNSSSGTLRNFWNKIIKTNIIETACTDGNPAYSEVFKEKVGLRHVVTKAETCLVESFNHVLRYYLARLHRRTKCYSKSMEMLVLSIKLLVFEKLNLY
jgi:IS1 family transposase